MRVIAGAGSVAAATLTGETLIEIDGAEIVADSFTLGTVVAGGRGHQSGHREGDRRGHRRGGKNRIARGPTRISPDAGLTLATMIARAMTKNDIFAFAISAAKGQRGLGGALTVNTFVADAKIRIGAIENQDGIAQPCLALTVDSVDFEITEENAILAVSGIALGGAIVVNTLIGQSGAELVNSTITPEDTDQSSHLIGKVTATTESRGHAVAAAVATKQGNVLGALSAGVAKVDVDSDATVTIDSSASLGGLGGPSSTLARSGRSTWYGSISGSRRATVLASRGGWGSPASTAPWAGSGS